MAVIAQKKCTVTIDDLLTPMFNLSEFGANNFPELIESSSVVPNPESFVNCFDIIFETSGCGFDESMSVENIAMLVSKYIHIEVDDIPEEFILSITVADQFRGMFETKGIQAWLMNGMFPELIKNIEDGEIWMEDDGLNMTMENLTITNALIRKQLR